MHKINAKKILLHEAGTHRIALAYDLTSPTYQNEVFYAIRLVQIFTSESEVKYLSYRCMCFETLLNITHFPIISHSCLNGKFPFLKISYLYIVSVYEM